MISSEKRLLSSDVPLDEPSSDELNHQGFAQSVADALAESAPANGLVTALYGPWGAGKSTVLNFIAYFLERHLSAEDLTITRFNPWWFSSSQNLIFTFFEELIPAVARDVANTPRPWNRIRKWYHQTEDLRAALADLGAAVSRSGIPPVALGGALLTQLKSRTENTAALKAKVERMLRERKRRYLVIIDDIDRLTASEIRQLFTAIKSVANLPQVSYLLAFDRDVVSKALEGLHSASGNDYLDKIVQVSFELPSADRFALRKLLFDRLAVVVADVRDDDAHRHRWQNLFYGGIDPLIRTPRDVVRLVNALSVTFPPVRGEVNAFDFIALEAIRIFAPAVYDAVRNNQDAFAAISPSAGSFSKQYEESMRQFHDCYLQGVPEPLRESFKGLLKQLFPRLQAIWGNVELDPALEAEWRVERRVCARDVFPIYFRLSVPAAEVGNLDIQHLLGLAPDSNAFAELLRQWTKDRNPLDVTKAHRAVDALSDHAASLPSGSVAPVLQGVFLAADKIQEAEPEHRGAFELGVDVSVLRLTYKLLRRIGNEDRAEFIRSLVDRDASSSVLAQLTVEFGREHGRYGREPQSSGSEAIVSPEFQQELEDLVAEKIRRDAESGVLIRCPTIDTVLLAWKDFRKSNEAESWIASMADNQRFVVALLTSTLRRSAVARWGDAIAQVIDKQDPGYIGRFLDLQKARTIAKRSLVSADLPKRERRAIEVFLEALDSEES